MSITGDAREERQWRKTGLYVEMDGIEAMPQFFPAFQFHFLFFLLFFCISGTYQEHVFQMVVIYAVTAQSQHAIGCSYRLHLGSHLAELRYSWDQQSSARWKKSLFADTKL